MRTPVFTLPADPAAALNVLLTERDQICELSEQLYGRLVHELQQQPGAAEALDLARRSQACAEAADLATSEALRLLQAWVRSLGGVVDKPAPDECAGELTEGAGKS